VNLDTEDFTAWTYLLQYVDQENDVEAAREAYDAFLSRYCYCYGYWRKYADYEKKKGSFEKCDEVSSTFPRVLAILNSILVKLNDICAMPITIDSRLHI